MKLVVFDIDGTLAPFNKSATEKTRENLKKLEETGVKIALMSGMPIDYVSGQARQLGLTNPIVSGENGSLIYLKNDYPITDQISFEYPRVERKILEYMKKEMAYLYKGRHWVIPHRLNYSFKILNQDIFSPVNEFVTRLTSACQLEHHILDGKLFDINYKNINKGWGVRQLMDKYDLGPDQVVTIGDGENDIPMFKAVDVSYGINREGASHVVKDIDEAFENLFGGL